MRTPRQGFTLVELMIVVAIISVLSAIAIPSFAGMQVRARYAKCAVNVVGLTDVITAAALDGSAVAGDWGDWHPRPAINVDKNAFTWTEPTANSWPKVDYVPDGAVRCAYSWTLASIPGVGDNSWVAGACNVDGDEDYVWMFLDGGAWGGKVFGPNGCVWEGYEGKASCPSF